MKITTTRAWRREHLNTYQVFDFDCFEDYFLYLHLNSQVLGWHVLSGVLPIPFLPGCLYQLIYFHRPWPFLFFSLWFYGLGFASHWLADGLISKTVKNFGPSYLEVLLLNFRVVSGRQSRVEAVFCRRYPHVLWVFQREPAAQAMNPKPESRFLYPLLVVFVSLGAGLAQSFPAVGWGLILLAGFLGACGLLDAMRTLEHTIDLQDPLTPERHRLGRSFVERVRGCTWQHRAHWQRLQAENWWFWRDYFRLRLRAFQSLRNCGDPVPLNQLNQIAEAWQIRTRACLADPEAQLELESSLHQDLLALEQRLNAGPGQIHA